MNVWIQAQSRLLPTLSAFMEMLIKIDRNEIKRKLFPVIERRSLNDSLWLADVRI